MKKENINYRFTAIPTNFIYLMDNDCFKLFAILLQKETYWEHKGMLKDGYFIKSISELGEEMNIKNRKDMRLIIEALYRKGLISIQVQAKKYNTAKFKLNWDKINEYLDKSIYDLMEFEERIVKLNRNETITYTDNVTDNVTNIDTKCTTTKDNKNKIENKNNNKNISSSIYNKENTNNKEKENNTICIHTTTKEKESGSWLSEVEDDYSDIGLFNSSKESFLDQLAMRVANNKLNFEFN